MWADDRKETLRGWFASFTAQTGERVEWACFAGWPQLPHDVANELVEWAAVPDELLDEPFDSGFGGSESPSFTAWSASYVLFPGVYDGAEWLAWVPRHPVAVATGHVGGGDA